MALVFDQGKRVGLQAELAVLNKVNKKLIRKYDNTDDFFRNEEKMFKQTRIFTI